MLTMGKNARDRKARQRTEKSIEQALIDDRRRARVAVANRLIKRVVLTGAVTVMVIYLGLIVNGHLPTLVSRLKGGGL